MKRRPAAGSAWLATLLANAVMLWVLTSGGLIDRLATTQDARGTAETTVGAGTTTVWLRNVAKPPPTTIS